MALIAQTALLLILMLFPSWESTLIFNIGVMLLLSTYSFTKKWNNLFLSLLTLEFLTLVFFLSLSTLAMTSTLNLELFFLFFTLAVCEASLGVAALILFSHASGSESLYSLLPV